MSTDAPSRATRKRTRRSRAFAAAFAAVAAILAVVGLAGATANIVQGPRVTDVQVDPAAAAAASGARLIVTTTQPLAEVDASQVTITPETPFAVDTSGRSVGVRFTLPLWDDTEYTVVFTGVQGAGAGPAVTITETFRTPPIEVFLLQRGTDEDAIFRTDLTGEQAQPVFRHPHIEDYRATSSHLVMSVRTDDDEAQLIVTDLDGQNERTLTLPGEGYLSNLQTADRGQLIGYTFSDADLSDESGRESALFVASVNDSEAGAEPRAVEVAGADTRISEYQFVPDSDSLLLLSFDGSLLLTSGTDASAPATALGFAFGIDGIARGTSAAVVMRPARAVIDLTDASEEPLVAAQDGGLITSVTPLTTGGTVRASAELDAETGQPTGRTIVGFVDDDGETRPLMDVPTSDAVLQTCVSPSERYVAVLISPDAVTNSYDTYRLPLPRKVETHILTLADGAERVALAGSSISWCQVPPG